MRDDDLDFNPMQARAVRIAIDRYEKEVIGPIVSEINLSFTTQIFYHLSLIGLGFLIASTPVPLSILGTLIGFMGISANWHTAHKTFERFQKDKKYLMMSLIHLRSTLDLCSENDEAGLMEAKKLMKSYLAVASPALHLSARATVTSVKSESTSRARARRPSTNHKEVSTMSGEMEIDTMIGRLFQQYLDSRPGYIAGDSIPEWIAKRKQAYSSFSPHFKQDNLKNVEAVSNAYRRWLRASNNKSWTNMQRVGVRALDQPKKLCKLLSFIQQETVPIEERIQKGLAGEYKVDGIGKGILTALLHTIYPEKYGVWNGSTINAFRKLDIYIPLMYSKKQGQTYVRINAVLNNMASVLDSTLTFVDGFMWYIATPSLGIII